MFVRFENRLEARAKKYNELCDELADLMDLSIEIGKHIELYPRADSDSKEKIKKLKGSFQLMSEREGDSKARSQALLETKLWMRDLDNAEEIDWEKKLKVMYNESKVKMAENCKEAAKARTQEFNREIWV